jgi:copper chaperone CopZ
MKRNLGLSILIAGLLGGCQTGDPAGSGMTVEGASDSTPITESTATLWVSGMSCPLCASNIDKQLTQVKGVSSVSVDLGSGRVVVQTPGETKPSRKELARAIRQSGFTLTRIETP